MEKEIKYYTRSNGEKIPMKEVEFTHLSNGLAKAYRDIFESKNKDEFSKKLNEINDMKEEIYERLNKFNDNLED